MPGKRAGKNPSRGKKGKSPTALRSLVYCKKGGTLNCGKKRGNLSKMKAKEKKKGRALVTTL